MRAGVSSGFRPVNEVSNAKAQFPHVVLRVVSNIRLAFNAEGEARTLEGDLAIVEPWSVSDSDLSPSAYYYASPTGLPR